MGSTTRPSVSLSPSLDVSLVAVEFVAGPLHGGKNFENWSTSGYVMGKRFSVGIIADSLQCIGGHARVCVSGISSRSSYVTMLTD